MGGPGRTPFAIPWLVEQVATAGDECIPWPFAASGLSPSVRYQGRLRKAHHVALILVGREPPARGMVARHRCNNGLCVNPHHVIVGTYRENTDDRLGYSVAMTADAVRAIRASTEPRHLLASRYGVSKTTITNIRGRRRWAHIE